MQMLKAYILVYFDDVSSLVDAFLSSYVSSIIDSAPQDATF